MSKILGIDYGKKRIGIAQTDDCQIIASALTTVSTSCFFSFCKKFFFQNLVEKIVVGMPYTLAGNFNLLEYDILCFLKKFSSNFPKVFIERIDERFTSKIAAHSLFINRISKKKRKNKNLINEISATLILQTYLEKIKK